MKNVLISLGTALLLAAGPTAAQDTTQAPKGETAAPVDGLAMGAEVTDPNAPGTAYVRSVEGDWELRCVRAPEGQVEPCNLYQLLKDDKGNSVAEMSIFAMPDGQTAVAGAQIITPLETLLTQQLTLKVDGGAGKRYPYTFCNKVGCYAQIGFTAADIAAFRKGNAATLTIVPVGAPKNTTVDLKISLTGFTASFKEAKKNTDAQEAARK